MMPTEVNSENRPSDFLRNHFRFVVLIVASTVFPMIAGCLNSIPSSTSSDEETVPKKADVESLQTRLDENLEFTLQHRELKLNEQAAWQILHGALAFGQDFEIGVGDQSISAVEYILDGGNMTGWTVQPGKILDASTDRRGLIAVMEPGTKTGQGHHDQWLAILAQCDLERDQPIKVGDRTYTIGDYVEQVKWDVPRNLDREYSWTLIGLTTYEPTSATWEASDGQQWSIARLLESEVSNQIGEGACGGTHRLIGITMALQRHKDSGGAVEGVWADAEKVVQDALLLARQHQNPDGTFSTNYITLPGSSPDLAQNLGATGHVLEFISLALPAEDLKQEWIRNAAAATCKIFEQTKSVSPECGALYHAAHGLVLYREKVYGPRRYVAEGE